jgi:hypothetical protein
MVKAARVLLLCIALAATAHAAQLRDYLRRDVDDDDRYHVAIRRILSQGWRKDVVLRTLVIPPFSGEIVVGIRRNGAGYRTFVIEPRSHIWLEASPENKHPNYSKIRAKYMERLLRADIADRCIKLWYHVLNDARNYRKEQGLFIDTTQVYFFVRLPPHEALSAWTHEWTEKARAGELLDISNALTAYIDGKMTEAKFLRELGRAEKKLR